MRLSPPLVEIIQLQKHYPRNNRLWNRTSNFVRALEEVSLQIFPGETVALLGESGSGKTTLAHCLFRLTPPSSGNIFFEGRDVWAMRREELQSFRRQAQFILQDADAALNPRLNVGYAIAEPLLAHNQLVPQLARQRAYDLLQLVGLQEQHFDALPRELSYGQRHRVVIARALALQPKFIAVDEPFASLDVLTKSRLWDLFMSLQQQLGLTYFFISHDPALVKQFSTRTLVMHQGKLLTD